MLKKKMLVGAIAALISYESLAVPAEVVRTSPVVKNYYERVPINEMEEVCTTNYAARGAIERTSRRVFGSSTGALGSAIGVAIGDKIGSGSGRHGAMVVGAIVGNEIGNNINQEVQNATRNCELRPSRRTTVVTTQETVGYRIQVRLDDGSRHWITREYEPRVGDFIEVQVSGVQ